MMMDQIVYILLLSVAVASGVVAAYAKYVRRDRKLNIIFTIIAVVSTIIFMIMVWERLP